MLHSYVPIRGVCVPIAGILCVKYNINKEIITAVQPLITIFSPACGGSQKFNKIKIIITKTR